MKRWLIQALAGLGLLTSAGCACEAILLSAVVVTVTAHGEPIPDALVKYSVDGGPFNDCTNGGAGTYACGFGTGAYEIIVEHEGVMDSVELDLDANRCHVNPQSITVDLS